LVVKIGFIGAGFIANKHLPGLLKIENAKVVAVSDIIPERAKNTAKKVNATAYSNFEDMLNKEDLDAVYVFTPPFVREILVKIAELGLPFLVEKPVALTVDQAKKIEHAIIKSGVLTSVGYMFRYFKTTNYAKKLLEENGPIGLVEGWDHFPMRVQDNAKINDVFTVPSDHWLLKKKGGAQIVESTTHLFDLARYLIGEVSEVYASFGRQLLADVQALDKADVSAVSLKFKNGAIGSITSTLGTRKTDLSTSLKVTAKNAVVEHLGHSGTIKIYEDTHVNEIRATVDPFFEEDMTFIQAVATGDDSKIKSSYSDGIETLRVTTAAVEAAREKKVIYL
jgi:predicted dehydrogenase